MRSRLPSSPVASGRSWAHRRELTRSPAMATPGWAGLDEGQAEVPARCLLLAAGWLAHVGRPGT